MYLDQYYTKSRILQKCATITASYLDQCHVQSFVDFSCGTNEFAFALSKLLPNVRFQSFDICPPKEVHLKVTKANFLTLKNVSVKSPVACGLNPPYGPSHALIPKFVKKAKDLFDPVLLFLIIPIASLKAIRKLGFQSVQTFPLPEDAFYVPGGTTNFKYPTCFCVLQRSDIVDIPHQRTTVSPQGYTLSTGMDPTEAHVLFRTSGRHAGEDIIGRTLSGYMFLRYNGTIESKPRLSLFKSLRDATPLRFDQHWMKIHFDGCDPDDSPTNMKKFLFELKNGIKDPERNLKSPPAIRKEYIVKFLNAYMKKVTD